MSPSNCSESKFSIIINIYSVRKLLIYFCSLALQFVSTLKFKNIIKVLMIQKNSTNNQQQFIIEHATQQSLAFFVRRAPLTRANFPILQLTYTMWRQYTFQKIKKNLFQNNRNLSREGILRLFNLSQKQYLPKFIERIKSEMNLYYRGLKSVQNKLKEQQENIPKCEQQIYEFVVQLGKSVWEQQLYIQLIQDLIRLPYIDIFSPDIVVFPRPEYATDFIFRKKKQSKYSQLANNAGKNMFNKVIKSLTTTVFSKTFALKINTLFGSFNPLVLGATFGLSQYLQHVDKKNKELALQVQIKTALQLSNKKVQNLKDIYQTFLSNIELLIQMPQNEEQLKKKIKELFLTVFEQEWLHIQVTEAQDGWQVVKLQEKESFQDLTE